MKPLYIGFCDFMLCGSLSQVIDFIAIFGIAWNFLGFVVCFG
jgi:hypothetical protein